MNSLLVVYNALPSILSGSLVTVGNVTLSLTMGLLLGVPMGLRETQDEFCAAGFYVNTVPLRVRLDDQADSAAVADAVRQMRQAIEHSRYGAADIVPEFLATHAHFEAVTAPGLEVHRLGLQLRASKLTASFTLVTGAASRIVLEYDSGCVTNAQALLQELARDLCLRHGRGFNRSNLVYMRLFYLRYAIGEMPSQQLSWSHCVELLKSLDSLLDRLVVCHHTAEPSCIYIMCISSQCLFLDRISSLLLCTYEKYLFAIS